MREQYIEQELVDLTVEFKSKIKTRIDTDSTIVFGLVISVLLIIGGTELKSGHTIELI